MHVVWGSISVWEQIDEEKVGFSSNKDEEGLDRISDVHIRLDSGELFVSPMLF